VGYNVARALTILGDTVNLMALIGNDPTSQLVVRKLKEDHLSGIYVLSQLEQTPESVILYDHEGKRQIHVDLKNIQEQTYPEEIFDRAIQGCSLAVLCNINFSRSMLKKVKQNGIWTATDVHAIRDLEDPYNRDFMETANILFMSDESLLCSPEEWVRQVQNRYGPEIVVVGLGSKGIVLAVRSDHFLERLPAVIVRPIVNTIGAGDALFSCFVHYYTTSRDPYESIRKAVFFASYKIGVRGAAEGFLNEQELVKLILEFSHGQK
jgi:ribokinase